MSPCLIPLPFLFVRSVPRYLHPAQEDAEQPPQPEPEEASDDPDDPFPMPNFESRLVVSFAPQEGQRTSGSLPKTSFSKQ